MINVFGKTLNEFGKIERNTSENKQNTEGVSKTKSLLYVKRFVLFLGHYLIFKTYFDMMKNRLFVAFCLVLGFVPMLFHKTQHPLSSGNSVLVAQVLMIYML